MKNESAKTIRPITDRTFDFSIRVVNLCRVLAKDPIDRIMGTQLLRSGTSIGANIEEAQAAHGKAEFVSKSGISLKEARETHYWLRLVAATNKKTSATVIAADPGIEGDSRYSRSNYEPRTATCTKK